MIDRNKDVVEWALLGTSLSEAREHLGTLLKDMDSPDFDEVSFGCQLSHVYSHLNRAWNGRDRRGPMTDADYERFIHYPRDLVPDEGFPSHADTARLLRKAHWHIRFRRLLCFILRPFTKTR